MDSLKDIFEIELCDLLGITGTFDAAPFQKDGVGAEAVDGGHVMYGGTADQLLALRQGEVHFSCAKVADVAALCSGDKPELRILGVFNTARLPEYPDVPTLGELGYYKEWYGSARALVLPKGTPQEIVDFYVDAFRKTMQDPACIEAHQKAGMSLDFKDNKQLAELIAAQEIFCRDVVSKLYKK